MSHDTNLLSIDIDAVVAGKRRLTPDEAMTLYHHAPLHDLGRWADAVARRIHGDDTRTFVIDRNINYTNVCSANCTFCAFYRNLDDDDAYVLDKPTLREKLSELADIGGTQVLLQGGMHPELPLSFYDDMLGWMSDEFPQIHLHAFSPPEFVEFVAVCEIDDYPTTEPGKSDELPRDAWLAKLEAIMRRLMDAGLKSLPGGGGEILVEHVRRRIGVGKATGPQWLDVMRVAHKLGMRTSATMMFGHIEGIADRMMHMNLIRDAQDEAIAGDWPGRYVSFISWPFQPDNTPLGRLREYDSATDGAFPGDVLAEAIMRGEVGGDGQAACKVVSPEAGRRLRLSGSTDYLRTQAISRLFFDNIHSIGASWVTMGPKIGQLGLSFGANDMGSVMMEENVVSSAGTTYCLNEANICRLIRDSGFTPAQRDNAYNIIATHDGDDAPDRTVDDWSKFRPATSAFSPPPATESAPQDVTVSAGESST